MKEWLEIIGMCLLDCVFIGLAIVAVVLIIALPFALIGGVFWFICWTIKTLFL